MLISKWKVKSQTLNFRRFEILKPKKPRNDKNVQLLSWFFVDTLICCQKWIFTFGSKKRSTPMFASCFELVCSPKRFLDALFEIKEQLFYNIQAPPSFLTSTLDHGGSACPRFSSAPPEPHYLPTRESAATTMPKCPLRASRLVVRHSEAML